MGDCQISNLYAAHLRQCIDIGLSTPTEPETRSSNPVSRGPHHVNESDAEIDASYAGVLTEGRPRRGRPLLAAQVNHFRGAGPTLASRRSSSIA
jgi:hypothetical protein